MFISTNNYWPKWMNLYYVPSSGSLLNTFQVYSEFSSVVPFKEQLQDYFGGVSFSSWGQSRVAWVCYTSLLPSNEITVSLLTTICSGNIPRAKTLFEFFDTKTKVFFIDNEGIIYFRNLHSKSISTTPSSSFVITLGELVKDSDVYYSQYDSFYNRLLTQSDVDTSTGIIKVPVRINTSIIYYPQSYYQSINSSGYISINNGPSVPLIPIDLKNTWDDLSRDITRYFREDNYSLFTRNKNEAYLVKNRKNFLLNAKIANRLNLVTTITWVPTGSLNLESLNISSIFIEDFPEQSFIQEFPTKIDELNYKTSKVPIQSTLRVVIGGYTVIPKTVSNNTITLIQNPGNSVKAIYSYRNYIITKNSSGYISLITPVSGNCYPRAYTIYISKNILSKNFSGKEMNPFLFLPDGTGNTKLFQIAKEINEKIKITLGYAFWNNAHWFNQNEVKPQINYVPRFLV